MPQAFDRFDTEQDGTLDLDELGAMLKSMGHTPGQKYAEATLR